MPDDTKPEPEAPTTDTVPEATPVKNPVERFKQWLQLVQAHAVQKKDREQDSE